MNKIIVISAIVFSLINTAKSQAQSTNMGWIQVAKDGKGLVSVKTQAGQETESKPFLAHGFNYDHDETGRLIEDYWEQEWSKVEEDFQEMKDLGANVARIHLQYGKFWIAKDKPNPKSHEMLKRLIQLAEKVQIYLDLTGLGCYHKKDVPAWYDELSETDRWQAQAQFWEKIAEIGQSSPAILCYDLMNEPVVPGGKRKPNDWLGPDFAGKHFVQFITLDQANRPRPSIAKAWTQQLANAVRSKDKKHLITIGLVDWSLDRPGLTSGFVPKEIADSLDFLCVHLYPETNKVPQAIETLKGFQIPGKPLIIEETFPLKCSAKEFQTFFDQSKPLVVGWVGFYWGKTREELRKSRTIPDAIVLHWLDFFAQRFRPGEPAK